MCVFRQFKKKFIFCRQLSANGFLARSFLLLYLAIFTVHFSYAADLCIPRANGVPGTLLWQKPPNWYDSSPSFPIYDDRIDAPSWRGAVSNTYPNAGSGTTEHVKFRALHREEGSTEYLYLSWYTKVAPFVSLTGNNLVWVGFSNPSAVFPGPESIAIKIELNSIADQVASSAHIIEVRTRATGAASWVVEPVVPAWLTDTARVWISTTEQNWAIHLRVRTTTDNSLANGVKITSDFRMWFETRVKQFPGYTVYKWPRLIPDMVGDNPPDIASWGDVSLTNATPESPDATCPVNGVSLLAEDVGTTNADPHAINLTSANTFFAQPTNMSSGSVNLKARFRIANWGVQATWEDNSNPGNTLWEDLGPATGYPPAGVNIASGVQGAINFPYTISSLCDRCEYKTYFDNPANTANCNASCLPAPPDPNATNGTKRTHQCLLVELIGPGVDFINDSVYRNMNFVNASEYSEVAEINTIGLGLNDSGTMARDVYLFVETLNMPKEVLPGEDTKIPGFDRPMQTTGRLANGEAVGSEKIMPPIMENMEFESLGKVMPTYQVHAYYDSGLRNTEGGSEEKILHPMTSFGYFVMHEGSLVGWEHGIEGAKLTQLAPDYYKVSVGDSGVETINTTIEALERAYAINFKIGINNPHNSFSRVVKSNLSMSLGLEYIYSPAWSFEAMFGVHRFDNAGLGADLDISQIALNVRYYMKSGYIRPYVNAGIGQYSLDPGSSELGSNAGIGFLYDLMDQWSVDVAYNYYDIDSVNPHPQFSTLQIGLRYRF